MLVYLKGVMKDYKGICLFKDKFLINDFFMIYVYMYRYVKGI